MLRFRQKFLAATLLALGVAMLVWGGRTFARNEPRQPPATTDEIGGTCLLICEPTLGEIAEKLGVKAAFEELGCLAIAGIGLLLVCSSALSLMQKSSKVEQIS